MSHLTLQGDDVNYNPIELAGDSTLALTLVDTGTLGFGVQFLGLTGTTSVGIRSVGSGSVALDQLADFNNTLTTVTISGSEELFLRGELGDSNGEDGVVTDIAAPAGTTIHSSLTLINASATTGGVNINAGATNTNSEGQFFNGASLNANVTITYTGLTIKGGSGSDDIQNDAKNGIVTDGNGLGDVVTLGGAGAKATLGTGTGDHVDLGFSLLGTIETAGSALGDTVKFGDAATAFLFMGVGTEAGSTAGTTSIGLTKVLNAAAGMKIDFAFENPSNKIVETSSGTTLTATENAAVAALAGPGVAHFSFHGNEYFVATSNHETAVSSGDTIVELVGITSFHSPSLSGSVVTLA